MGGENVLVNVRSNAVNEKRARLTTKSARQGPSSKREKTHRAKISSRLECSLTRLFSRLARTPIGQFEFSVKNIRAIKCLPSIAQTRPCADKFGSRVDDTCRFGPNFGGTGDKVKGAGKRGVADVCVEPFVFSHHLHHNIDREKSSQVGGRQLRKTIALNDSAACTTRPGDRHIA